MYAVSKTLDKPLKCSKCKGVRYCSKECQKKYWSAHKSACHNVERSSGALKFVRTFFANITLIMFLKVAIIYGCGLLDNSRLGFDAPFMARVDIAVEPTDTLDFAGNFRPVSERLTAWTSGVDRTLRGLTSGARIAWRKGRLTGIKCRGESDNWCLAPPTIQNFAYTTPTVLLELRLELRWSSPALYWNLRQNRKNLDQCSIM
ncbi:hypothetical protein EV424DRAFT_72796 [Suillus variegatus]|nr:hypothetical protein EV424DRAFT_72796 [Suillus variegatus]